MFMQLCDSKAASSGGVNSQALPVGDERCVCVNSQALPVGDEQCVCE